MLLNQSFSFSSKPSEARSRLKFSENTPYSFELLNIGTTSLINLPEKGDLIHKTLNITNFIMSLLCGSFFNERN